MREVIEIISLWDFQFEVVIYNAKIGKANENRARLAVYNVTK